MMLFVTEVNSWSNVFNSAFLCLPCSCICVLYSINETWVTVVNDNEERVQTFKCIFNVWHDFRRSVLINSYKTYDII